MSDETATAPIEEVDPFADFDVQADTEETEIPVFTKMKKGDIVAWVKENVEEDDVPEGFFGYNVKEMRAALTAAFTPASDVTNPVNTGFDVNDLIHKTVAEVESIADEDAATKAVLELMDESEYSFFKIGGILSRFKAEGWTGEFDTFGDFVESAFGFKIRKAETLVLIYQSLISCGAPWASAKAVGWSKLGVIAKHLTADNWKGWFDQVKEVSHATVVQMSKDASANKKNGEGDGEAPESTPQKKISIVIHEDQEVNIKDALAKAKETMGTDYDGPALHAIALDYLATPVPVEAPTAPTTGVEEGEQEADEVLTGIFQAMREGGTLEECLQVIFECMEDVFPEADVEISLKDGDDSTE